MKILILYETDDSPSKLVAWLEARGHAVVGCVQEFRSLFEVLAAHDHDIVISALSLERTIYRRLQESFLDSYFIEIGAECLDEEKPTNHLVTRLEEIERTCRSRALPMRPFASGTRMIFHADEYRSWASAEKRHAPVRDNAFRQAAESQAFRFLLQLRTARNRHEQARRYLRVLRRHDRGLLHETAYRLAHGSYKIAWLREHLSRWLTVIAHYIPGCEVAHCPAPREGSPHIVAINWAMPLTYLYPIACVRAIGTSEAVFREIMACANWTFQGQPEPELVQQGIRLFGVCAYLAQVAQAQVRAFGRILDGTARMETRAMRRDLGIVFEFQAFIHFWQVPDEIESLYQRYMAGDDCGMPENSLAAPSFVQFRALASKQAEP